MTETETDFSLDAADARQKAVTQDALGYNWRETHLHPWSSRRELTFLALQDVAFDGPLKEVANKIEQLTLVEMRMKQFIAEGAKEAAKTDASGELTVDALIDWSRFLPDASIVLWLAHHEPKDWRVHASDYAAWIEHIMSWADEHILPAELIAAVRLAHTLRTAHRQLVTIPRPDTAQRKSDAGN